MIIRTFLAAAGWCLAAIMIAVTGIVWYGAYSALYVIWKSLTGVTSSFPLPMVCQLFFILIAFSSCALNSHLMIVALALRIRIRSLLWRCEGRMDQPSPISVLKCTLYSMWYTIRKVLLNYIQLATLEMLYNQTGSSISKRRLPNPK